MLLEQRYLIFFTLYICRLIIQISNLDFVSDDEFWNMLYMLSELRLVISFISYICKLIVTILDLDLVISDEL